MDTIIASLRPDGRDQGDARRNEATEQAGAGQSLRRKEELHGLFAVHCTFDQGMSSQQGEWSGGRQRRANESRREVQEYECGLILQEKGRLLRP